MLRSGLLSGAVPAMIAMTLQFVAGCSDEDPVAVDNVPPFPPDGVFSVTGDGEVTLFWTANWESDLAGYAVYRSTADAGPYNHLGDVAAAATSFTDLTITNGDTRYYAITAFDAAGNESEFSYELVFDTPRPAGTVVLWDNMGQNGGLSGYDLSSLSNTGQSAVLGSTDVYFEQVGGVNYLFATGATDLQDFGVTASLDELDWAPASGWAPSKRAEAITGHAYFLRMTGGQGDNYAKIRVNSLTGIDADSRRVTLEWAYQEVTDLPELSPGWKGGAGK